MIFKHYFSNSYIFSINTTLLKYGHYVFKLDILEYYNKNKLIEQYYIDLLKPEYNILKYYSLKSPSAGNGRQGELKFR